MGRISKYSNLYDKECTSENYKDHLIKHVSDKGVLKDYTIAELETLVKTLQNDKDENGNIKNAQAYKNVISTLFEYYNKYGYPNQKDHVKATSTSSQRPIDEQVTEALTEAYDDYEEIKEA